MSERDLQPRIETGQDAGAARLTGQWTLAQAESVAQALKAAPDGLQAVDATGVDRLDSLGVLQLMRFARHRGLDAGAFHFNDEHQPLVTAIGDVADDRPRRKREYGVAEALARLGRAVHGNWGEVLALVAFLGEVLVKMARLVRQPGRFRLTPTVHHMEQVGLDAVPLVALLCYLVGAVIAFLGANVLRDFGATQFVVELVTISFLREFAVLLTAIILAGRTASAFTAHIGSMVSREEVDAIRALGLDPVDLLVIPRVTALLVMLPLLTFLGMIAGLLGGLSVGAFGLDIPPQQYLARMQDTMDLKHMWVGLAKAPVFAMLIGLIGCLEGLQVTGTAQSVGERTTSSVVQSISVVIILDAFAAMWFMEMGW
ncbi:ABC transporter permease [Lysobacter sp. GX 14042]|uniref:ABC transporter permease n=1 Tax=Lysobacter sp. GX 14042 TaxID=2907155 RepID=UPI001F4620C4|nr:ABC transporter permease [Lysobacter sp. GX 14042]MCE7033562.1 ABC transporter permease [Lysobacter sp. GX 14042]